MTSQQRSPAAFASGADGVTGSVAVAVPVASGVTVAAGADVGTAVVAALAPVWDRQRLPKRARVYNTAMNVLSGTVANAGPVARKASSANGWARVSTPGGTATLALSRRLSV